MQTRKETECRSSGTEHRHPGPRGSGTMRQQRDRAADRPVLKLIGEKQEILQGFLAPWVKAFEEWVPFAPSSLYLELKSRGTHLCKPEQKCQKLYVLSRDTLKAQGSLLLPPDSQPSDPQFSGVSSLSPCCPVSPEKPSQQQGCGIPSHLQHRRRCQDSCSRGLPFHACLPLQGAPSRPALRRWTNSFWLHLPPRDFSPGEFFHPGITWQVLIRYHSIRPR